ncbi:MAG TPA: DUF1127 domain-containing protein [Amaricoccus sp.]|uniref:DUF1127 domain-containing protein n=1 Tax=Amaricoccus sp. TaxID=1872485 RepID=UPI002C61C1F9|nr:DUF1127 domain-containing protein [Amaricoccus sp.]HMQ95337.1 DUF1127 domain-containing protein [Amaricoccus sp.]HMR54859.1 DUF1127 domain-containing protein [Amaricoccus sp.]HMR62167.1 DUF1127 domain-containing protein [Amaricoccus sp.]HMU01900.1 DUF1127 domain-containing protein [Amaricoccus sp.]
MISTDGLTSADATIRRPPAITPSAAAIARAATTTILSWGDRRRQRHALAELDDHLLRDIGLTRHQARTEALKPFWCG